MNNGVKTANQIKLPRIQHNIWNSTKKSMRSYTTWAWRSKRTENNPSNCKKKYQLPTLFCLTEEFGVLTCSLPKETCWQYMMLSWHVQWNIRDLRSTSEDWRQEHSPQAGRIHPPRFPMPTNLAAYAVTQVPQRHIAGHDPAEITSRHMEMSQRDYQIQAEQNNLGLDWKAGA